MFGKRAEVINKYCKKGNPLFVEGRLTFDSWQGQDGSKRSKLRVTVENFEFMGQGSSGGGQGGKDEFSSEQSPTDNDAGQPLVADEADEIPF
jgi:single-strand DNA-binding protein